MSSLVSDHHLVLSYVRLCRPVREKRIISFCDYNGIIFDALNDDLSQLPLISKSAVAPGDGAASLDAITSTRKSVA